MKAPRIWIVGIGMLLSLNSLASLPHFTKKIGIDSSSKDSSINIYRATAQKVNDLVHTKLDVRFDYAKHYLYGKEWVTLKPHFYPTDSLSLDAKGMDIHSVSLEESGIKHKLAFDYQDDLLKIKLGKVFHANQTYTIYIDYTAKPDEIKQKGSAAITSAKGLYFINSDGSDPEKPIQIWTQGETESSSCWFPTIDKPNQKTTDEISMTVPSKYVTLSNGKLVLQKKNLDGTRTDTWKMDLPHAPYLFMMAVGDFKIYHDHWKNKEVNYYLEPKYAPYAAKIFGETPEMMSFYAKITGVDFPWNKYSQIVVRDYVSGAMENTTATLHGDYVQKTSRELLDEDGGTTICHELFHQWFGDYVTCESWSNITLNESFATLSEILWTGHSKGKDAEDAERYDKLHTYLSSTQNGISPSLVRFHYKDREDVFDNISYPKGSVILYALKNHLGDEAFYAGLNTYLKANAFKSAEAQQLRLAFEQVSGEDLNWYFNQWYYGSGHPILDVSHSFNQGITTLNISQKQDSSSGVFRIPIKIGIYAGGKLKIESIIIDGKKQIIHLNTPIKPDFIDFDIDKIIVGEVNDHKNLDDYAYSYFNAGSYSNRLEAVKFCLQNPTDPKSQSVLLKALKDPNYLIRKTTIDGLNTQKTDISPMESTLMDLAKNDPKTIVQAAAISKLSESGNQKYLDLCKNGFKSQSYAVIGASLNGLLAISPDMAEKSLKTLDSESQDHLSGPIAKFYATKADDNEAGFFDKIFKSNNQSKEYQVFRYYLSYLAKNKNPAVTQNGVNNIVNLLATIHQSQANTNIAAAFKGIAGTKLDKASSETDPKLKQDLTQQSEIFNKAAQKLLN